MRPSHGGGVSLAGIGRRGPCFKLHFRAQKNREAPLRGYGRRRTWCADRCHPVTCFLASHGTQPGTDGMTLGSDRSGSNGLPSEMGGWRRFDLISDQALKNAIVWSIGYRPPPDRFAKAIETRLNPG